MKRQIQHDAWGSARIARVSQHSLHENCPQMIEKEQWPPNNSLNFNGMEISRLGNDAQSYLETYIRSRKSFWIKSRTREDMGQFSAGPINKAVRSSLQI